jgi:C4-dicarboxylate-specific signal transduction histidine kinase
MASMINNFMTAVRSYQRAEPQFVRLNQLVTSAVEVLKGNDILKHKIRISMDLSEPDTIYAVPMEIMQIIDNVLANAAEAMAGTDRFDIHISTESTPERVLMSVEDQGTGIADCSTCDKENCMQCRRFSIGKTTKSDGTGIGVVYVREIMKEIGGTVRFQSVEGEGTTVSLSFPLAVEEESSAG